MSENFILLTGCSGGGKTTLLEALSALGHATVPEPGRRIVAEELASEGTALPWVDLQRFAVRAVAMSKADLQATRGAEGPVFFDRGLIDAALALEVSGGPPKEVTLPDRRPYARQVFVVPPWPEKFATDAERRHSFDAAVDEYERILRALDELGYEAVLLPRLTVRERVEIVLQSFGSGKGEP